jgi:hypothetical protein
MKPKTPEPAIELKYFEAIRVALENLKNAHRARGDELAAARQEIHELNQWIARSAQRSQSVF